MLDVVAVPTHSSRACGRAVQASQHGEGAHHAASPACRKHGKRRGASGNVRAIGIQPSRRCGFLLIGSGAHRERHPTDSSDEVHVLRHRLGQAVVVICCSHHLQPPSCVLIPPKVRRKHAAGRLRVRVDRDVVPVARPSKAQHLMLRQKAFHGLIGLCRRLDELVDIRLLEESAVAGMLGVRNASERVLELLKALRILAQREG
mmetsp:Transcript_217/g.907  ORF Transcript_217/g.907 Transcript_217/m.907 type:complete len:203 (+) Transcript_217:2239-2847(+)